jgi:hypothetical protein
MVISREHESGFGNSYQAKYKLYGDNSISIEVNNTNFNLLEVPF